MGKLSRAPWTFLSLPHKKTPQDWPSIKAKQALAALLRIGWRIKRQRGTSHRILERPGWADVLFGYHDRTTLGPTALKVLAKKTGLRREDL
jgi:predicted RNA binding protein YcfA (HicA-like mRNA interferase family)